METKMIKVVYFDEQSAIDFLQISEKGSKQTTRKGIKVINGSTSVNANVKAGKGKAFELLSHLLPINFSAELETDLVAKGSTIIETTLSNTVLSKYYERIKVRGSSVERISGHLIYFPENSMTFLKSVSPIFTIFKEKNFDTLPIEITKIGELVDSLKGYYSAFAVNSGHEKKVLRFNFKAFRNNYRLTDLPIMDLVFYAVKVGTVDASDDVLSLDNEFVKKQVDLTPNIKSKLKGGKSNPHINRLSLYDVVLAGVEI